MKIVLAYGYSTFNIWRKYMKLPVEDCLHVDSHGFMFSKPEHFSGLKIPVTDLHFVGTWYERDDVEKLRALVLPCLDPYPGYDPFYRLHCPTCGCAEAVCVCFDPTVWGNNSPPPAQTSTPDPKPIQHPMFVAPPPDGWQVQRLYPSGAKWFRLAGWSGRYLNSRYHKLPVFYRRRGDAERAVAKIVASREYNADGLRIVEYWNEHHGLRADPMLYEPVE